MIGIFGLRRSLRVNVSTVRQRIKISRKIFSANSIELGGIDISKYSQDNFKEKCYITCIINYRNIFETSILQTCSLSKYQLL